MPQFTADDELEHLRRVLELARIDVEPALPDERQFIRGKMRLHFLDWGTVGLKPVVFLHGGGLNAHTWDAICLGLRATYHCMALDQRGHGDSEWSPELDYRATAHLKDIEGLVNHLGLKQFVLIGQSLGGLNAFNYASQYPDRLAGLVVIDTGPNVSVEGGQRIRDFLTATERVRDPEELVEKAIAFNPLRDARLLRRSIFRNIRQLPDGSWIRKNDMRHLPAFGIADLVAEAKEIFGRYDSVRCPTLIIRGEISDVLSDQDAEEFSRRLPQGEWIRIERAGHTVQGDNPGALLGALTRFLARLP